MSRCEHGEPQCDACRAIADRIIESWLLVFEEDEARAAVETGPRVTISGATARYRSRR